jgi:hypothetical protein
LNIARFSFKSHTLQIDYSVKLFADLGDSYSTYNSHRAYSFSDKIFTAGFSSLLLKVSVIYIWKSKFFFYNPSLTFIPRSLTEALTAVLTSAPSPLQSF